MKDQNRFRRISIALFFLSLIMFVVHIESLIRFNRGEHGLQGNESSGGVGMNIDCRADSTSTWLKRSFVLEDGREADLIGQTIDGTLSNETGDLIRDWELRIDIIGDCYINQAWTGEVEIHQYVGTEEERVQRLNLQDYKLEDVTLKYRYDGDLLIPLKEGDFVFYYPSVRFGEMPVEAGDDAKIGVIFYYLDELDLSHYEVTYHFHRGFTQGTAFYAFAGLLSLWVLSMTVSGVSVLAYRRAMKEMELRKSGIFSMSDIYDLIYLIHLPTGEMTPVTVDEKVERDRPKNKTAKELLTELVYKDTEEKFWERLVEFVDTDTLADRLKERNSISCEFQSIQYGWCILRFFAMESRDGGALENVVFAVQNIEEEKKEQEAILQQIEKAQSLSDAKAAFADSIVEDLQRPLESLVGLSERILLESSEETVRDYARRAHSAANRLLLLTEGLVDSFGIEFGRLQPSSEAYSLRELLQDILHAVWPVAEEKGFSLSLDASDTLPDQLEGDSRMLREALAGLLCASLPQADGGSLQLAVYGKVLGEKDQGERVHLLFTVRVRSDSPNVHGISGMSREVVSNLLTGMGSALKSVHSPAGRSEVYFELEQRVLDDAPMGKISVGDLA